MTKIAAYCRVSTDREDQANSFESQQRYFREYIARRSGWELYDIYADEGITGTSTQKRVRFNQMISDGCAGKFQLIVTKEVSRFSRNILDTISFTRQLKSMGIPVLFMNDGINTMDPDAELRLSIMASIAQEESRKTSSRVVWGQTRQMEKGVVFGRSLLGYDVANGKITVNPDGAEVVRLIFQKYTAEQLGTTEIAKYLTGNGYRTYLGSPKWHASSIIKILKNEKYVGDLIQKKTYTPNFLTHEKRRNRGEVPLIRIENHHEPIITREIWNMAQARLRKNNRHKEVASGRSGCYTFSGKIKCGECGAYFVARFKYLKDGTKVRRWCCGTAVRGGTEACSVGKIVRDDDAMQMLKTAVKALQLDTDAIVSSVTALALESIQTGVDYEFQRLQSEMQRIQKKREAVMDSYFSGEISKEDMIAMKEKYDDQINYLRRHLEHVQKRHQENSDIETLRNIVSSEVTSILTEEMEGEVFYKTILQCLTVFKDRHMELRLHHLPHVFLFFG